MRRVLPILLSVACGGPRPDLTDGENDDSSGSADDGLATTGPIPLPDDGSDGIDKPPPPPSWQVESATRICDVLYTCDDDCTVFPDETTCVEEWAGFFEVLEADVAELRPDLTFDPGGVSRFVREAELMGCQTAIDYYPGLYDVECDPRPRMVYGDREPGETCSVFPLPFAPPLYLGWQLVEPISDCAPGSYCAVEHPDLADGPPVCVEHCRARPGEDEPCEPQFAAGVALFPPSASPDRDIGVPYSAVAVPCEAGLWCDPTVELCRRRLVDEEPCMTSPNFLPGVCPPGLLCLSGLCQKLLVEGECASANWCGTVDCPGGSCTPLRPEICKFAGSPNTEAYSNGCDSSNQYCGWW